MLHLSFSFMYRLNQTESANLSFQKQEHLEKGSVLDVSIQLNGLRGPFTDISKMLFCFQNKNLQDINYFTKSLLFMYMTKKSQF
jgi:hypothetical protein